MKTEPDWNEEGRDWPMRETSRFVRADGLDWHVQLMGSGPPVLLLHGTGAATHSWRGLAPLLSKSYRVISLDLPGHGFTQAPPGGQFSLPRMTIAVSRLLSASDVEPAIVVGHSAGVAIAIRLALAGAISPQTIVSFNGAVMPFPGLTAFAFPALAKLLFLNPFAVPFLVHRASSDDSIARLIRGTGSHLDARGIDLYARLFRTRRHMAATIGMMANWDLVSLKRDMGRLVTPLMLVTTDRDRTISPQVAVDTKALVRNAKIVAISGYGHLAHEEAPEIFYKLIRSVVLSPC